MKRTIKFAALGLIALLSFTSVAERTADVTPAADVATAPAAAVSGSAAAATQTEFLVAPAKKASQVIALSDGANNSLGDLRVTIQDWKGEPIAKDSFIKLELRCPNGQNYKSLKAFNTCAFEGVKFNSASGKLTLQYRQPVFVGYVRCDRNIKTIAYDVGKLCQ